MIRTWLVGVVAIAAFFAIAAVILSAHAWLEANPDIRVGLVFAIVVVLAVTALPLIVGAIVRDFFNTEDRP